MSDLFYLGKVQFLTCIIFEITCQSFLIFSKKSEFIEVPAGCAEGY